MKALINKIKSTFIRQPFQLDEFWIQKIKVSRTNDRMDVFKDFLVNKSVLHVGCTDHPVFDAKNNLHIQISNLTSSLHGMDIDNDGIDVLRKYVDSEYYNDLKSTYVNTYDTVLVPETIEHVENIGIFLKEINNINAKTFIITGPNCFHSFFNNHFEDKLGVFTEAIHPDHNCWFSPYTLKNVIEKYTELKVIDIHLCSNDLMVVCICEK